MDVFAVTPASPRLVSRVEVDAKRRRRTVGAPAPQAPHPIFDLPDRETFDSSAPVAVDAVTEAAVAGLRAVDMVPLCEAIDRYTDAS